MATFIKKGDDLVTCPYDPAHRLKRSRLQMHIAKCKSNNLDQNLAICPFNATHRVPSHTLDHHITVCPERHPVDKKLAANLDKNNIYKGRTAVPSYSQSIIPGGESWENEISPVPVAGYTPQPEPPKNGIVLDMGLTKPSERKQFYKSLFRKGSENERAEEPTETKPKNAVKKEETELRKPKQKFEEYNKQVLEKFQTQSQHVGLGRGQPKVDSRIAANIFSSPEPSLGQPQEQPIVYRQLLSQVASLHLGVGRGQSNPSNSSYDSEFPVLGLGRGQPISPQEKINAPSPRNMPSKLKE